MTQPSRIDGLPDLPAPAIPVVYAPAGGFAPTPRSVTMTVSMPQPYYTADQMNAHGLACYEAGSAAAAQAAKQVPAGLSLAQEPKYTVNGSAIVNRASGEAIPVDEPVFIFRARDKHAIEVLEFYRDLVRDQSHREAIDKRTGHFYVFKNSNPWRMKEPDTATPSAISLASRRTLATLGRSALALPIHAQAAEIERIAAHSQTLQRDLDAACDGESKWQADYMRLSDEFAALKAKQVAEAAEVLRLADEYANAEGRARGCNINRMHAYRKQSDAAREALRAFLTKDRT